MRKCLMCKVIGPRRDLGHLAQTIDGWMHWRCIPTYIRADSELLARYLGLVVWSPPAPWWRRVVAWLTAWRTHERATGA